MNNHTDDITQGVFKYTPGRTLPENFRKVALEEDQVMKEGPRKEKRSPQGYTRNDELDMKGLKKYTTTVAKEITLFRKATY